MLPLAQSMRGGYYKIIIKLKNNSSLRGAIATKQSKQCCHSRESGNPEFKT
jgi:hypothetical protein